MVLQTILTRDHIRDIYREKVASQEKSKRDEGRRYVAVDDSVSFSEIVIMCFIFFKEGTINVLMRKIKGYLKI